MTRGLSDQKVEYLVAKLEVVSSVPASGDRKLSSRLVLSISLQMNSTASRSPGNYINHCCLAWFTATTTAIFVY